MKRDSRPSKGRLAPIGFLAHLLSFGFATSACGACDTTGQDPIEYKEGITTSSESVWLYESTAVNDEWLHFPPGRIYDLVHGLPGTPQTWSANISFKNRLEPLSGSGTAQDPNNAAPAAGNQVVVDAKWGPNIVRIRNDTCAEVYVRFDAQFILGESAPPDTPQSDMSVEAM
jgi:hypothetical protein